MILLLLLLPLLITAAASVMILKRTYRPLIGIANFVTALLTLGIAINIAIQVANQGPWVELPDNFIRIDTLSVLMIVVVSGVSFLAVWFGLGYLADELREKRLTPVQVSIYTALLNLFVFVMLLALIVNNIGVMWVAIEATTLTTAFLIGLRQSKTALEASWKYILIGSVGIGLAFIGTLLVYYGFVSREGENALNWSVLITLAPTLDPALLRLAFIFIVVGYGTKAGLAPMHAWMPDAQSEAPAPISGLMSGALEAIGIYAILRFKVVVDAASPGFTGNILLLLGALSVAVAALLMLTQRNYKRMLAYSSIEHMGLIALGIGFGGPFGYLGAMLHILNHAVGKSLLFFISGNIFNKYGSADIDKITGLGRSMPWTGFLFMLGSLAILGVPPFSLFFSEILILRAGFAAGYGLLTGGIIILLMFLFGAFLIRLNRMVYGQPESQVPIGDAPAMHLAPLWVNVILLIGVGLLLPAPITVFLNQIVVMLGAKP